jgi:hypothetical protein
MPFEIGRDAAEQYLGQTRPAEEAVGEDRGLAVVEQQGGYAQVDYPQCARLVRGRLQKAVGIRREVGARVQPIAQPAGPEQDGDRDHE